MAQRVLRTLRGNRDANQRYFRELLKVCVHADKPGRSEVAEADSQTALKPIIENDRVVVWDVTDSDGPNSAAFIDGIEIDQHKVTLFC
jgi:hypothetical protein